MFEGVGLGWVGGGKGRAVGEGFVIRVVLGLGDGVYSGVYITHTSQYLLERD